MVAELNSQLGGLYFTVAIDGRTYTLNPTNLAVTTNKFNYISIDGGITYSDMFHYLNGILIGIRAAKAKR